MTFFEYLWVRPFKKLVASREQRRRVIEVGGVLRRYLAQYEQAHDNVYLNVLPAVAHYLRNESHGRGKRERQRQRASEIVVMTQQTTEQAQAREPSAGWRLPIEPLDPAIDSIQPGGGVCMRIELGWGCVRRLWLRVFRRSYVRRMEALRRGDANRCPHPVLDPRDVKFYRNQGGYRWDIADDPFAWRDRLPVARVGLAELLLLGGSFSC